MKSLKSKINFNKLRNKKEGIKAQLKRNDTDDKKNKKEKTKVNKRKTWYSILSIITFIAICIILVVILFGAYIVMSAPEFEEELLFNKESTIIYDKDNEVITTLGMNVGDDVERRVKLSYEELPEVLIDAVVATEDSRFFQHNGVDIARFLKASFGQILGNSDAGGASTLTMQVSKNALTDTVDTGIAGIIRKFTDIYLSVFKIEKQYTKQDIIEMYLNSEFLGNFSYGVEQAAQTYFGKSASDVSLSEAALLAGLFQAPSAYDPFTYPEKAEARRNIVLNLMQRHGYITEEESEIAKSIPVTKMLGVSSTVSDNPYQGYIDTVIEEVYEKYDVDPYKVPVEIYTALDRSKQDVVNGIYNGESGYVFKDEKIQLAIAVVDNKNGELIAVGAHRDIRGERSYNLATMISNHPGSTIKPLLDYGPAFEYLNWSTYTPLFDEETKYTNGGEVFNWDLTHEGLVTAKKALSQSMNTAALQTFRATTNDQKWNFVTSLGITPENSNGLIYESSAIGAFEGTNPKALAGAYSAFASGGYYTEPHSVRKIVFKDTGETKEITYSRDRVMKETTAFLITNILFNVTPGSAQVYGTQVATKTGTSSYDNSFLDQYGLSHLTAKDSWVATYNPDYTLTYWYGYENFDPNYTTLMGAASIERSKILGWLNPRIMNTGSKFTVPKGITEAKVELGTIPARLPSEFTPGDIVETHYFISGTEPTEVSYRYKKLDDPSNLTVIENGASAVVSWDAVDTPDAIDEEFLTRYFNNGYGQWAKKYLDIRLDYNKNAIGDLGYLVYLKSGENLSLQGWTDKTSFNIDDTTNYDEVLVKTAYSIFQTNASDGITETLVGGSPKVEIVLRTIDIPNGDSQISPTFSVGDKIPDIGASTIEFLVNGKNRTSSLSSEDISYTIYKCTDTTLAICSTVNKIDSSSKSEYKIVYEIQYMGETYEEKRYLHIK